MNMERYTERARGFVQAAQTIAMREGHPQFTPEHILKALLDDPEGMAAGLIDRAGGERPGSALRSRSGARVRHDRRPRSLLLSQLELIIKNTELSFFILYIVF